MEGLLERLWKGEEGQDLVEYGLLVVLIALGAIVGMNTLASAINAVFTNAASNINANS
jgi:pilus assembly protein Flp/PilA